MPSGPHPANPQALNRYSYVQNNPLTFADPSGHQRRSFFRALFAAVAAVATTIITGGQGELGIAVYSAIVATAGAIVGDQVGKAADRAASAGASSTAAAESSASLLGTIMRPCYR